MGRHGFRARACGSFCPRARNASSRPQGAGGRWPQSPPWDVSSANTRGTNLSPCPGKDAFFSRPTDHKAEVQTGDGDICKIEEHPQCIRPILTRSCRGLLTPRYLEGGKNLDVCRQLFSLFLLDTGRPSVQTIQIYVQGFVEKRR